MMWRRAEGGWARMLGGVRIRGEATRGNQDSKVQMGSEQKKRNEQFRGMKMFTVGRHGQTGLYE